MEENKNTTRAIREKVRRLKDEREKLHSQLEKYDCSIQYEFNILVLFL